MSQSNPIHALSSRFCKRHLNAIFQATSGCAEWIYFLQVLTQTHVCIAIILLPVTYHAHHVIHGLIIRIALCAKSKYEAHQYAEFPSLLFFPPSWNQVSSSATYLRKHLVYFPMTQQPPVGQGLLIIEASRSHSDTPRFGTLGLHFSHNVRDQFSHDTKQQATL
jgi:hypothetical protein